MTLWLYLYFPCLQLDTLYSQQPESSDDVQPIAIVDKHQIVQLNNAATELGIEVGMGLATAASLCHNLQVIPYQQEIEETKLNEIAQWLYLKAADITLFSPKGLLLKVSNMLTLYQSLEGYWSALTQHLNTLNVSYHFASGFSPFCAKLLAQQQLDRLLNDRQALLDELQRYPLACSELESKTVDKLNRVGVTSLAELLALNITEIARRFDIHLVNYVGRLTGRFHHPLTLYHPPLHFERHLELLYELDNVAWLEKPLAKLLTQLEQHLRLRDQLAFELKLTLHQRDKPQQSIHFHSAKGEYRLLQWQTLSALTLENLTLEAPVTAITLSTVRVDLNQALSQDLFDGEQGALSAQELISILSAKLGEDHVSLLEQSDDPRPEYATLYRTALHGSGKLDTDRLTPLLTRPSLLLPSPVPLQHQVSIVSGPERIQTGWWDNHAISRDYFIAQDPQGRWLWVYRTPSQQWYLHGLFS